MFRYVLLVLALCLPLWSQQGTYNAIQAPDCQFFVYLPSGTATTVVFDNRTTGCTDWAVTYNSSGYSAVSFLFQSAPNNAGSPGTWGAYGGTTVTGSNPMTSTTQTSSTFSGYQPWLRASVTLTGSGIVQGAVYGWRYRNGGGGSSGSGCPDPCPVIGVDAPGAASTADPVQVAGNDGTNVRAIKTDTGGNTAVVGSTADGGSTVGLQPVIIGGQASGNVVRQFGLLDTLTDASATGGRSLAVGASVFDGTNWNRQRGTTNGTFVQGPIASGSTAAGNPVLIGGIVHGGTNVNTISTRVDGNVVSLATSPGKNPSGGTQQLAVASDGGLRVATQGTVPVDGQSATLLLQANAASGAGIQQSTFPSYFNGTTYDRMRGSVAGGLTVGGFGSGATGTLYGMTACDSSAVINVTAGSTTGLVGISGTRSTRVCGFTITASAASSTATFVQGLDANCTVGASNLTGAMAMGASSSISLGSGLGELFKTGSAFALCLTAVTGNITGVVTYARY